MVLPEGLGRLILVGFLCLVSGTVLAVVMMRRVWLLFPVLALAFAPGTFVAAFALLVLETVGRPTSELDRATLPDGRVVMLGVDPVPTDVVFSPRFAEGLGWRPAFPRNDANSITHPEDGSFTADPRLVLAPDSRRPLVRRGGIWTDCFEIGAGLKPCPGVPRAGSVGFRARSAEIKRLVYSPE